MEIIRLRLSDFEYLITTNGRQESKWSMGFFTRQMQLKQSNIVHFGCNLARHLLPVELTEKQHCEIFLTLTAGIALCGVPFVTRLMACVHFSLRKQECTVFHAQNGFFGGTRLTIIHGLRELSSCSWQEAYIISYKPLKWLTWWSSCPVSGLNLCISHYNTLIACLILHSDF